MGGVDKNEGGSYEKERKLLPKIRKTLMVVAMRLLMMMKKMQILNIH